MPLWLIPARNPKASQGLDINVFLGIIKGKNIPSKAMTEESRLGEQRSLVETDREAVGMD